MSAADVISSNVPFGLPTSNTQTQQDEEKIWTKVLQEVSSKARNTLQGSSVIMLGEKQCGKTSLFGKLEKSDTPIRPSALEYSILNVPSDGSYAYQLGTAGGLGVENLYLPVWTLDGDEAFAPLLGNALPATAPSRAVILLCASLDNPGLIHSIRRWANLLSLHITQKYDKTVLTESKNLQERYWQEYVEPSIECSMTTSMVTGIEETGLLPVEPGVLTDNCGANIVVVITKADLGSDMTSQQADRIIVQVRQLCLQLGAALVYTSSKTSKGVQTLYKYIIHRAYGLPFTQQPQLIERDSVFVPAGWDGQKKIDIIKETVPDVDEPLEPTREKPTIVKEQLVEAENEQMFLSRLAAAESVAPAPVKKAAILDEGGESNSPLASFFSNLLKDKPATSPRAAPSPQDAQAQLDRILKGAAGQSGDSA
ncbi:unnamed protein product [Auanema sp. JU1783]|nr:unnamed protein product [Auanema sp. JU1783]